MLEGIKDYWESKYKSITAMLSLIRCWRCIVYNCDELIVSLGVELAPFLYSVQLREMFYPGREEAVDVWVLCRHMVDF